MKSQRTVLAGLWVIAVLIPLVVVWLGAVLISDATAFPDLIRNEGGPLLFLSMLVGGPFALLALWTQRAMHMQPLHKVRAGVLGAVLVGMILAMLPWGWLYYDALTPPNTGANIGIGLVIIASPLYVGGGMVVGYVLGQYRMRT